MFHLGVTTSRATSGERRKDRNTGGQRGNKFNASYRYISVVVAELSIRWPKLAASCMSIRRSQRDFRLFLLKRIHSVLVY